MVSNTHSYVSISALLVFAKIRLSKVQMKNAKEKKLFNNERPGLFIYLLIYLLQVSSLYLCAPLFTTPLLGS